MSTGRVAGDLRAILDMADRLEARAVDLADADLVGGEAMVNLAPVASMSDWERRNELAGDELIQFEDPDELWSSFQMLRFWSEQWRTDLGQDHEDPLWRPSLRTEAGFLRNPDVLAWAWDNEPHFDDFAADVERARRKLEDVLREGERAERLRVTCPDCAKDAAQDDENGALSDEQGLDGESHQCDSERPSDRRTAPRLIARYGATHAADRWKCPRCKHQFDRDAVRRAQASQMRTAGIAQRWITVADATSILRQQGGWRERTIHAWANDRTEVSAKVEHGVRLVWWPDMWRLHLLHRLDVNEAKRKAEERERRKADCVRRHGSDCWVFGRGCSESLARMTAV